MRIATSQPNTLTARHIHTGSLLRRTNVLKVWIAIAPVKYAPPVSPICVRIPAHKRQSRTSAHPVREKCPPCASHNIPAYKAVQDSGALLHGWIDAPFVTLLSAAHCALITIEILLNALLSMRDAMYAPSCVWKNAREWCWLMPWRLRANAMRGSHE